MAKEKDRVELRPVDESAEKDSRLYRLHKDAVEEVDDSPPVRVGEKPVPEARLEALGRDGLKIRSVEPGVASLIERDAEEQEKLESEWEGAAPARVVPWGWMALIGCAFAAGVLWSLIEVTRSDDRNEGLFEEANSILDQEREEEMEAERTIAAIENVVGQFFDSRSVDELLRYVRHPQRVKPLVENYYATDPFDPRRVERILSLDPLTIDNHANFWMVLCELSDGSNGQVLIEVLAGSVAKVDWETFVCYQPMEWDEFARTRPPGYSGEFRVYVEPDNYHTYQFSDSEIYAAYRLTALDSEEVLYGYVERGTSLADELEALTPPGEGRAVPLILRLEVPRSGMSKRGLHVRELVSARWMYVESPEVGP